MLTKEEVQKAREKAVGILEEAGIVITQEEKEEMEVVDYGLGELDKIGTEIVVYVNTERYCAKELILFPWQICPEHRHPPLNGNPGKQETFRCRWGKSFLHVSGKGKEREIDKLMKKWKFSEKRKAFFTVRNEIVLEPGEQYTIPPDTKHWFQAGPKGAVISEFSSKSVDEEDIFTDPEVKRIPRVKEE